MNLRTGSAVESRPALDWKDAAALFDALSRSGRIAVFRSVLQAGRSGVSPTDVMAELRMTGSALSFHLRALTEVGLIRSEAGSRRADAVRPILLSANLETIEALISLLRTGASATDRAAR